VYTGAGRFRLDVQRNKQWSDKPTSITSTLVEFRSCF